jgi:hypothetical protein
MVDGDKKRLPRRSAYLFAARNDVSLGTWPSRDPGTGSFPPETWHPQAIPRAEKCRRYVSPAGQRTGHGAARHPQPTRNDHPSRPLSHARLSSSPTMTSPQIYYRQYAGEADLPRIMALVQSELSEPYVIYTFRYFLHQWSVLFVSLRPPRDALLPSPAGPIFRSWCACSLFQSAQLLNISRHTQAIRSILIP